MGLIRGTEEDRTDRMNRMNRMNRIFRCPHSSLAILRYPVHDVAAERRGSRSISRKDAKTPRRTERIFSSEDQIRSFLPWRLCVLARDILPLLLRRKPPFNSVPQSINSQRSGMGAGMSLAKIAKAGTRNIDFRFGISNLNLWFFLASLAISYGFVRR
jgi:hypothetical protein